MNEPDDPARETKVEVEQPSSSFAPTDWISTDQLDTELWNAIMEDTRQILVDKYENWNEEFDVGLKGEDLDSNESEQRQETLICLSG
jgi:hypothetical protein